MIKIRNLTKIYNKNKENSCVAINNINLDLPNKGFVFIIGKSGSGKSTLLNMIGTLDSVTSGDIIVNGVNIARLKEQETQNYRCFELGFIFQNYILLDELTVKENIALASDLVHNHDEELLDNIIKAVELEGMENKYPNELSGGQRQRVAIARALIKNPEMLLCDEPTGNLDFKISKQILKLLKDFSKDRLVIIVSHNIQDAETYADRIIELEEGTILSDKTRSHLIKNEFNISDNIVTLPHHKDLSKEEVIKLNEYAKENKFVVEQHSGSFVNSEEINEDDKITTIKESFLSSQNQLKISRMFSRKNKAMALYTIFITMLFISLLFVMEMFVMFDANNSLKNTFSENPVLISSSRTLKKGTISSSYINSIDEEKINVFYENGYQGNIYKIYNNTLNMNNSSFEKNLLLTFDGQFKNGYLPETLGLVCCDEELLLSKFGVDGEVIFLEGSLEEGKSKHIITDYIADKLILMKDYSGTADYSGVYQKYNSSYGGIVYTGYKERYGDIIEQLTIATENGTLQKYLNDNRNNKQLKSFLNEIFSCLGYTYMISNDYYNDFNGKVEYFSIGNCFYQKDGEDAIFVSESGNTYTISKNLVSNEVSFKFTDYNTIFGTSYTEYNLNTFVPHSVKIYKCSNVIDGEKIAEYEIYIKALNNAKTYCSKEGIKNIFDLNMNCIGLMFDNIEQENIILKTANELDLIVFNQDTSKTSAIYTVISIFKGLIYFVIGLLLVFSIVHIILYGITSIKKNSYEIGVLKSLGTKSKYINRIFLIKVFIVGLIIGGISIIGICITCLISDKLLIFAFEKVLRATLFDLKIISISPLLIFINILLVWAVSLISSLIPILYLKKIKPLDILRENKK